MMAKSEASDVKIVLACVYSGAENSPGPGSIISVDAAEAERLIGLGAATPFVEDAQKPD